MNTLPTSLKVYIEDKNIGVLKVDNDGIYSFVYDQAWLDDKNSYPISRSLPLQNDVFEGSVARNFFKNLLPEELVRKRLASIHGVSEGNDYALLSFIGGECAGAISLLPEDKSPHYSDKHCYQKLNKDQLESLIEGLSDDPMLSSRHHIRLSLAGAQNKLPLRYDHDQFFIPKYGAPSNCIVKPSISIYPDSTVNELYCMRLASSISLPVPKTHYLKLHSQEALVVERYDRQPVGDKIIRLHQEDFCQLTGRSDLSKYEAEGGPTLSECANIIREWSTMPIDDLTLLTRWVIFNVLIGNNDAHAKNISILYQNAERRLSPFYDLLTTRFYERLSPQPAMSIGGCQQSDLVNRTHWEQLASDIGVSKKVIFSKIDSISSAIISNVVGTADKIIAEGAYAKSVNKIMLFIAQRTRKLLKQSS